MQQTIEQIEEKLSANSYTYMALNHMLEVDLASEREESFTYTEEPFYIFDDITLPQEEVLF